MGSGSTHLEAEMRGATLRGCVLGAALVGFALVLLVHPAGTFVTAVDDVSIVVGALAATVAAAVRARTLQGRARTSWTLMAAAFGATTLGEGIWGWYELVLNRETPFPSVADVAYLTFPVLALAALLLRPSTLFAGQGRLRTVLDGLLVSGSLFNISWLTTLGPTFEAGGAWTPAFALSLAYPVSDLVLLTTVLLLVTRTPGRVGPGLLAAGLAVLALSDSTYTYLAATDSYQTGNPLDIGYFAAYLLLLEAAVRDRPGDDRRDDPKTSWAVTALPYVPVALAVGVAVWQLRPGLTSPTLVVGTVLVFVLLLRQLLTLIDNRRLVQRVLDGQEQLQHQAFHDSLTSLANRALFIDRVAHAVELHHRTPRPVAVLLLDLDDFKSVNDGLGHAAGDELLVQVAERLRATTREGDTVARLGGDEFAVLTEDDSDPTALARRILRALDQPVLLQGRRLSVQASVGIAPLGTDPARLSGADLLRRADLAMYAAKRAGKGIAMPYQEGMTDGSHELDLRSDVSEAIATRSIDVHFQPLFTAAGSLLGFEALSRWTRHGVAVPPDRFIPAAERAGLLRTLDELVLERSLTLLATELAHPHELFVTVNASMDQLTAPGLTEQLARALERHGLAPAQLVLEVPEHRLYKDPAATAATLQGLRRLGVRLALDDFGVGYSSLARLQELPPDIVKIDRCFISPLGRPGSNTDLLAGMIDLAHRTGAMVVAEGVERPEQLSELRRLGCDAVQGYLLGRPAPAAEAAELSRTRRGPSTTTAIPQPG
jgi:diguanylate cyclase (GGDEF)-like protein